MSSGKSQFQNALCLLCFVLLAGCIPEINYQAGAPIPQVSADTVLSAEEMRKDLDYTVSILKEVHPKTYHGFSNEQQAIIKSAYKTAQAPMEAKKFYFLLNSAICSMNDGHTHLRPMQNKKNRFIDILLIWLHDGLYVSKDTEQFKQADEVVAIGNKSTDELFRELRLIIPSENEHYLRHSAGECINREEFLDYLNVISNNEVEIRVQRGRNELSITAPLKPKAQCHFDESKQRPWVGYEIDKELSLGVFYLDECRYDQTYKKKVKEFFTEVGNQNIQNVAVDVRRNGGGNSKVVDEFLRYVDIDNYNSYFGDIRYSKAAKQQNRCTRDKGYWSGEHPTVCVNKKVESPHLLFNGNLFVLTSPKTFSSGNWFAVIIKDNQLGTIIGEPTGNAPTSYGDVLRFYMPATGFQFTVSFKKWVRPNTKNDPEDSLYPDVLVYTTIEDIKQAKDPQLEKLKDIIRNTEK
jgi:hypothetical protein